MHLKTPGEYSWEFLVGVCCPVHQIQTLCQTKRCHFPHPFSDQTCFQTWPLERNCHHYLHVDQECKQKYSSNAFWNCTFLFHFYLLGIETINTFIHSCSSLENHIRFQTKIFKVCTCFRQKRHKNPTRWGGTYLYSLCKEVPPPPRAKSYWENYFDYSCERSPE